VGSSGGGAVTSASVTPTNPTASFVRRRPPAAVRRRKLLLGVANHSVLIAAAIAFLAPFGFITLTALMTNDQTLSSHLWPHPFHWANFYDVFTTAPLLRWTYNTLLYAVLGTLGLVLSSVPVAYALARLRWRGRNLAFMVVLVALMLPPQVLPLHRHPVAGDPPELVRRRLLDLSPPSVLPDDPGGVPRRGSRGRLR
jgi:multiple sugar transport system permease protein